MTQPDISIITPGGDRPWSFRRLAEYLSRQTFQGIIQWLVMADCKNPKPYVDLWNTFPLDARFRGCYMHMFEYDPGMIGPKSLARNLLRGLTFATGKYIVICEDDDWYHPDYLQIVYNHLTHHGCAVTGPIWQKYYHLPSLSWKIYKNIGSALCSTAFHNSLRGMMQDAARWCQDHNKKGLDRRFWDSLPMEIKDIYDPMNFNPVIGMKGLPGRFGIGVGHQPRAFNSDADASVLKDWVGEKDAEVYLNLRSTFCET